MAKFIELGGRILLSAMFLISGLNKIAGYAGTQAYMASQGVPGSLLPLVIAFEVAAPILVDSRACMRLEPRIRRSLFLPASDSYLPVRNFP